MNTDLKTLVKATLKRHGQNAAAHFGVAEGTLAHYKRTGKYPLSFVEKILAEQTEEPKPDGPMPPPPPEGPVPTAAVAPQPVATPVETESAAVTRRMDDVVKYLQGTVDFYIKQFGARIFVLEKAVAQLSAGQLRAAGMPNLLRPDEGVPIDQTFTTNPAAGLGQGPHPQIGNSLDTGIAPTKEMVDAQAHMTIIEGVPVPNAKVAGPAGYDPNVPAYGYGWNTPRPPRK